MSDSNTDVPKIITAVELTDMKFQKLIFKMIFSPVKNFHYSRNSKIHQVAYAELF